MTKTNAVSVVVPVYNAEASLDELHARLCRVLEGLAVDFEIVFVDDGSRDGSFRVLSALAARDARVKAMRLMRNHGQHNALICGVRAASFPVVLTMDDDLQHPPEEIPKLFAHFGESCDVVYGVFAEERHGALRTLASRATKLALRKTMGVDAAQNVSAFRLFRTELRRAFEDFRGPLPNLDVMLSWGTTRFAAASVAHEARHSGDSGYTFSKLVTHALNMVTGFSVLPLKLASVMGFVLTALGIALLAYVLLRYLIQGTTVQGFPFLASIICIFSGSQLFCLGILGEYFARMYLRLMDKPMYTVAERVNLPEPRPQYRPDA